MDVSLPPVAGTSAESTGPTGSATSAESSALVRTDARRLGGRIVIIGAVAQAIGVGIDAIRHVRDESFVESEGLFSLGSVGHAFLVIGLGIAAFGILLYVCGRALYGRPGDRKIDDGARRFAQVAAPALAVALIGGGIAVASQSSWADGPSSSESSASASASASAAAAVDVSAGDQPTGAKPAGEQTNALDASSIEANPTCSTDGSNPSTAAAGETHSGHGNGCVFADQPMDATTRAQLADELVTARAVADRFATVAAAEAAGYVKVTPYVPLIGAHYMKFFAVDRKFDVNEPEMLLYDGTDSTSKMVGLSYYVVSRNGDPEGFAGPNDHWHRHIGLCVKGTLVVLGEQSTEEQCASAGGVKVDGSDAYMVHAWVVPGWESQQGVFSAENPALT